MGSQQEILGCRNRNLVKIAKARDVRGDQSDRPFGGYGSRAFAAIGCPLQLSGLQLFGLSTNLVD
jgi:hypothetical protein